MHSHPDEITQHPRERASIVSVLLFLWTCPTFKKGMQKVLEQEDLFGAMKSHGSHTLGERLEIEWSKEIDRKNPILCKALFRTFGKEIIFQGAELVFIDFLGLLLPYLIGKLLTHYMSDEKPSTKHKAYILVSIIVVVYFVRVIFTHIYDLSVKHLGMKIRIACSSLIYRKSLKLSKSAFTGRTIGNMVNLLSNDVARFDEVMLNIHRFWLTPIEVVVMVLFFYYKYGFKTIVGCLLYLIVFVPFKLFMGIKCKGYRFKMASRTDERMRWMSILVHRINVIKMYTLEHTITHTITSTRNMEMKYLMDRFYLKSALFVFPIISQRLCTFITITTNILSGNVPTGLYTTIIDGFHAVFVSIVMQFTVDGIPQMVETMISIKRIKKFLLLNETIASNRRNDMEPSSIRINFQNATAKWPNSAGSENTLTDINLVIRDKCLIAIIGDVGSGKTSLLKVVMKELPLLEGSCTVNGRLSYAAQEPWLLHASIKDNILLGQPMDRRRYREVLMICSLSDDLAHLEHGDRTLVGVRGTHLNIGQIIRISLARAFYRKADIYIFDYPFTAIDMHTSTEIFEKGILKMLSGKCILLVTQRVKFLSKVDKIVLLEKGRIEMFRTFLQMQRTVYDVGKILVVVKDYEDDAETDETVFEKGKEEKEVQQGPAQHTKEDTVDATKEFKREGKVTKAVYRTYIRSGGMWIWIILILMTFVLTQAFATGCDYYVSYWLDWEEEQHEVPYSKMHFTIYGVVVGMLTIITLIRNILYFRFCIKASTNLHDRVLCKIIHGKMHFFASNPPGRILNRFSKDLGTVDETLPDLMMDALQIGLDIFGVCIVVSIFTFWDLVPTLIFMLPLYFFRTIYLRTSRNLKRLEAISSVLLYILLTNLFIDFVLDKSPVFTHLNATIHGLSTIRAFEAQETMVRRFDDRQDLHSSAFYLLLACNEAFHLWVHLHSVLYITFVLYSYIYMGTEYYGSKLVTHLVTISGILHTGMIQWTETENHMTSVERLIEYMEVEQEIDPRYGVIPEEWPERGTIEFRNVYMRYSDETPYVLKNITFKIEQHEKVAIVGKTGHGKSSLISCLFMIADVEGDIFVDDVNVNLVPLQTLRSKITVVPQEPVLFAGTVRENVDPLGIYEDIQIWNVLDQVHVKNVVSELEFGLDTPVEEGGVNFTAGQRHLFCLAKAILYKSKILILDDITANIDSYTEHMIGETIRNSFKDCTVLVIVHNINHVSNYDKILFIEHGEIVEFDHPLVLLRKKGHFYHMLKGEGGSSHANAPPNYVKLGYRLKL